MDINIKDIVNEFRNKSNDKKNLCINEQNILYKCIYCRKYLSSNEWSPLLEKYVKNLFILKNKENNISGDALSLNNYKIEIKVSLGQTNGQFNFVQIRPDHDISYYIFLIYNCFEDEYGKIYWFLIPSNDLYDFVLKYGSYAHGTIKKLGKISKDNFYNKNNEYCLRPNCIKKKTIGYILWNEIIKYKKTEQEIFKLFNS